MTLMASPVSPPDHPSLRAYGDGGTLANFDETLPCTAPELKVANGYETVLRQA